MSTSMETNNSTTPEAADILAQAHQEELPDGWTVVPVNEKMVRRSVLNWLGGSIVGFGLFALLFAATRDVLAPISLSSILLLILGFIGIGSLWLMIKYIRLYADRRGR